MHLELTKPADVATELHVTVNTLANWRCLRKGPAFVKVGAKVLYPRDGLDAWLARHTIAMEVESQGVS
jgi:hypothetical protein